MLNEIDMELLAQLDGITIEEERIKYRKTVDEYIESCSLELGEDFATEEFFDDVLKQVLANHRANRLE